MTYAIIYSSKTGNTRLLAETLRDTLPTADCLYFGEPSDEALRAERIYVGFWTDKGTCDADTAAFLARVTTQEVSCSARRASAARRNISTKSCPPRARTCRMTRRCAAATCVRGKCPWLSAPVMNKWRTARAVK